MAKRGACSLLFAFFVGQLGQLVAADLARENRGGGQLVSADLAKGK